MMPSSQREVEGLVEQLCALVPQLKDQGQPLAARLLEMAVIDIRTRIYQIGDAELKALCSALSDHEQSKIADSGAWRVV